MIRPILVATFLLSLVSCSRQAVPPAGQPLQPITQRPAWLKQGIVMLGSWEPLTFLLRRGGQETDAAEIWKAERSQQSVRRLKELGVNLVILNLHKGAGLKAEAEDMQATRDFVKLAHQEGVRVGGYIGATMAFEAFFTEEPDARDWMQVDEFGRPVYYNQEQTFRYAACRNNPGYKTFIEKLLRIGVEDMKLDLIHFDQMQWWSEPQSCRCQYCKEEFRQFLLRKYRDPARARMRFGFTDLNSMAPPFFNHVAAPIRYPELKSPLMQEWAMFRAENLARHYAGYDRFIQGMNPEVALEGNPNLNLAYNQGFTHGSDYSQLLEHGDIVWSEEPNHAAWTEDGRIISKVRSFKVVRIMGKSLFVYTGSRYGGLSAASAPELRMAEAMAYNDVNLGMVGDLMPTGAELTPTAQQYIRFFQNHVKDLAGTVSLADVAVLRSFPAIEFNPAQANASTVVFEQTLLQNRIPFDIIFNRHLLDLKRYKVLVLANQDALSDEEVAQIRTFVNEGGGLVATENSSLLSEWRLRRPKFALADLFGVDMPGGKAVRRQAGKGRVAYIPRIEFATEPPPPVMNYRFTNEHWRMPKNSQDLVSAVEWASADQFKVSVQAPPSVTAELVEQKSTGNWLLHLVNFNFTKPVENITVQLRLPAGGQLREVTVDSPDGGGTQKVTVNSAAGLTTIRLTRLKVYNLVKLALGSPRQENP